MLQRHSSPESTSHGPVLYVTLFLASLAASLYFLWRMIRAHAALFLHMETHHRALCESEGAPRVQKVGPLAVVTPMPGS